MQTVTIEDPPRMNLLGLILASVIERNLQDEDKRRRRPSNQKERQRRDQSDPEERHGRENRALHRCIGSGSRRGHREVLRCPARSDAMRFSARVA